mgnify:CR=1 FL=1
MNKYFFNVNPVAFIILTLFMCAYGAVYIFVPPEYQKAFYIGITISPLVCVIGLLLHYSDPLD